MTASMCCHRERNIYSSLLCYSGDSIARFSDTPEIYSRMNMWVAVSPPRTDREQRSMWVMCPVSAIDHSPRNTQISNTYSYPLTAPENKGKIATKSLVKLNENLNWIDLCAFQCGTGGLRGEGCPRCEVLMNLPPNWLQASLTEEWISFSTLQRPLPLPQKQPAHVPHVHSLPLSSLWNIKD